MLKQTISITVPTPFPVGPVNFYFYARGNEVLLMDAGVDTEEAWRIFLDALAESGYALSQISGILLTHHHVDHIGLVNRITEMRNMPVYAHPNGLTRLTGDRAFYERRLSFFADLYDGMGCGPAGRAFIEKSRQRLDSNKWMKILADLTLVREGDRIPGWEELELVESFGHAPDHLMVYDREEKQLFSGDHLLAHISSNAIVEPDNEFRVMLPTLLMYRDSLLKTKQYSADRVYPGHGPLIGNPVELIDKRVVRMTQKAERILSVFAGRELTAFEIAKEVYPEEHQTQFFLVMSEIIGHLDLLELNNKIERRLVKGIWVLGEK